MSNKELPNIETIQECLQMISGLARIGNAASDSNNLIDLSAGGHQEQYSAIERLAEKAIAEF